MSDWQPIETAPKDGTSILVAYPADVGWFNIARWWKKKSGWQWVDSFTHGRLYNEPTHWMPLPPQPYEDKPGTGTVDLHDPITLKSEMGDGDIFIEGRCYILWDTDK